MAFREKGNIALSDDIFRKERSTSDEVMTLEGTVNKTIISFSILVIGAIISWGFGSIFINLYLPLILVTFIISLVIIFKPNLSPNLVPIYSGLEGFTLGSLSLVLEQQFPGIVLNAVSITLGIFASILVIYKSGLIKVTENFKMGVFAATFGILIVYLVSFIGQIFGIYNIPYIHESGTIGILFSIGVIILATLNLVLDFDFIENGVKEQAAKYMEWYGAFGLLVTLIWLYLEVLRLLMKIYSKSED